MPASSPAACETRPVRATRRRLLVFGILAGAAYALFRALASRAGPSPVGAWQAQPFPFPPQPVIDAPTPWVDAAEGGTCPAHHPVKAKLTSGIFHLPGGANYDRTRADRCYVSAEAAEAEGLRASKR
jgi:hypothetical protein